MISTFQVNSVKIFFIFTLICISFIPRNAHTAPFSNILTDAISCYEEPQNEGKSKALSIRASGHL